MDCISPIKLSLLKDSNQEQFERFQNIIMNFKKKFGHSPEFICRAPGRVNLIGEHIDYCGYSVLPMAVSHDICLAVSYSDESVLHLTNAESDFKDYTTSLDEYCIDSSNPQWFNYFLCGLKGISEYKNLKLEKGMNIFVHGTVPKAAGMSSSSALVCAAGLATAFSNECIISKHDLANECARCERYIGTQGGGMDQSISFLAEKGMAKLISFNPLRAEDVKIPEGGVFVITNSCVKLQKAATSHFNIRVAECKIGAKMLAKSSSIDCSKVSKFLDLQKALGVTFDEILAMVENTFHKSPYTRDEICQFLEISDKELKEALLSKNTQDVETFKLYQRAKHVFSEAQRVHQFKAVCEAEIKKEEALLELGKLMNQSHFSCSELYECSCPELDELTKICRESGSLGSRLTGAGWGGCAVSLVPANTLSEFLSSVKKAFYSEMEESVVKDAIFATYPGDGASVYTVS